MENSKRGNIPMQERFDLNKTQGSSTPEVVKRMQNIPYASAVGSIINTKDMFLVYGGNPEAELRVDCYCNVGFETDKDDIKSQTRHVFIFNGGAIAASEAAMEVGWIRKFISGLAELRVDYYCNAGFETDKDDIKSQTGHVFIFNGGAVD
ncbi:hypothetical protein Tco_0378403 [Tanacetum coccineum]